MNISHQNIYHRFVDLMDKDYLFFSHEFDGTLTYVTHQIYEILEMKAEEVIGQKWQEIFNIPNESIEKASEAVFECTKGIVPAPYEMKFITSTNKTVYLEIQEHPFFNENGDVAELMGLQKILQ
jgi:PAS domain